VTALEEKRTRELWSVFEACCSGLLADKCTYHRPYMGCPLDCGDVENTIGEEFAAIRTLIPVALDELHRLRRIALDAADWLEANTDKQARRFHAARIRQEVGQ